MLTQNVRWQNKWRDFFPELQFCWTNFPSQVLVTSCQTKKVFQISEPKNWPKILNENLSQITIAHRVMNNPVRYKIQHNFQFFSQKFVQTHYFPFMPEFTTKKKSQNWGNLQVPKTSSVPSFQKSKIPVSDPKKFIHFFCKKKKNKHPLPRAVSNASESQEPSCAL